MTIRKFRDGIVFKTGGNSVKSSSIVDNTRSGIAVVNNPYGMLVTGNNIGLQNSGTMSVSESEVSFNTTGASGAFTSFGNNRIFGNSLAGTAPTVGAPSSAHTEQ